MLDGSERSLSQSAETGGSVTARLSRRALRRGRSSSSYHLVEPQTALSSSKRASRKMSVDTCLRETLAELGCIEQDDSTRIRALDCLERILARWANDCDREGLSSVMNASSKPVDSKKIDEDPRSPIKKKARAPAPARVNSWQRLRPILITFGSYRLGVHRPSSDLDLLVLAPSHCSRDDFFGSLVALLKQQDDTVIQHVHPIPTAYTPVIKFTIYGIPVDLLFAKGNSFKMQQHQQKRPNPLLVTADVSSGDHRSDEYSIDDTDLLDQDEAGVRSLNGARVSQMILEAVPHLETYRTVLVAVKQWAIAKGVYSNVLGFLGGINYAIMVAHVCIHNPMISHAPVALLERFFHTFAAWKWPEPVMIGELKSERPSSCILPMVGWNPAVNRRDGLHIMPIITPAYPSMNSAYNVDTPQLRRMTHEMTLAANWMTIYKARHTCFVHLFRPSDFFFSHHHFLQVTITSQSHQDHVEWLRLVESRLRLLIGSIETPTIHAWPYAKLFHKPRSNAATSSSASTDGSISNETKDDDEEDYESSFYIALRFAPGTAHADLRVLTSDFCHQVNSWEKRTSSMGLGLEHILAPQLPSYVVPPLKPQDDASTETASNSWASSTDDDIDEDAEPAVETESVQEGREDLAQGESSSKIDPAQGPMKDSLVGLLVEKKPAE